MVCSSGISFDPVVAGERLFFDVAGIHNGVFSMRDRTTGSVWTHFDGTIIQGPLTDDDVQLEIVPTLHLRWEDWVSAYPDSVVLDWYPEYAAAYKDVEPGGGGLGGNFLQSLDELDERLPQNTLVIGVDTGTASRAYVLSDFGDAPTVLSDTIGGMEVAVIVDAADTFGIAFAAELDGASIDLGWGPDGTIVDGTGSVWDPSGKAVSGPLAGRQLEFVTSFVTEWYGWAAFHPDTDIYGR